MEANTDPEASKNAEANADAGASTDSDMEASNDTAMEISTDVTGEIAAEEAEVALDWSSNWVILQRIFAHLPHRDLGVAAQVKELKVQLNLQL